MLTTILQYVPKLLITAVDLIREAEEIYKGAKQGTVKKRHVLQALRALLPLTPIPSTYHATIENLLSMWIDTVVSTFNAYGGWGRKIKLDFPDKSEV